MNGASLVTLTGDNDDAPDDVYAGGVAPYERNLPALRYGADNPAIQWVKDNPLIVAAVVVAAVIIISKMKRR